MIGCCHCGSESTPSQPSESGLPSESASSATTVTSCVVCGIAPRNFRVTITNPTDSSECCCADYSGDFVLRYVSGCGWESTERMLCTVRPNPGTPYCVTALIDEPRITLGIGLSAGVYSYTVQFRYHRRGISTSDKHTHTYVKGGLASCFVTATVPWQSTASVGTAAAQCATGPQFVGNPCAVPSAYTTVNSNIVVTPL